MIHKYRAQFLVSSEQGPATVEQVQQVVRDWLTAKGENPPEGTIENQGDVPLSPNSSISVRHDIVENEEQWALRYHRADGAEPVSWVVDIAASCSERSTTACVAMGVELDMHRAVPLARRLRPPAIVARLSERLNLSAGCRVTATPHTVERGQERKLLTWAQSEERQLPLVVVTTDPYTEKPLLDPNSLQRLLLGLGEVTVLPKYSSLELTRALTELLGGRQDAKLWTVYNGAVRVYWPGFDVMSSTASPFSHKLWLPDEDGRLRGADEELLGLLAWAAVHRKYDKWTDFRSIERKRDIEELARLSNMANGASSPALLRLQNEMTELHKQLDASADALDTARKNEENAWAQFREKSEENRTLRNALRSRNATQQDLLPTDARGAVERASRDFPSTLVLARNLQIDTDEDGDYWYRVLAALHDLVSDGGRANVDHRLREMLLRRGHNGKGAKHGDTQIEGIVPSSMERLHLRWRLHMKSGPEGETESIYWEFLPGGQSILVGRIGRHA